ncbi:hypothetical protein CCR75_004129 [Bremia lactucae]|uniref:Signal recognition particle SRP54 subunit M-domain domain-containing protein n=1 Tax=Bremia lactucae TaxID=4779 RepID=A0A976FHL5_BRELC|nr:hypothetical protein CCR75_004129 [Bremia lactucae]
MSRATVTRVAALQLRRQIPRTLTTQHALLLNQHPAAQLRSFSVFSNIKKSVSSKLEERNQLKQGEAYKQQMIELSQKEKFDLNGFYDHLKKNAEATGATGWRSMIPGVSSMVRQSASVDLYAVLLMPLLYQTAPQYLENPRLINGKVKRKISETAGHSPEEINNMLRNYEQLSALHMWLVKRVQRGLSIPETLDETTELVRQDPTGFPTKKFSMKTYIKSRQDETTSLLGGVWGFLIKKPSFQLIIYF